MERIQDDPFYVAAIAAALDHCTVVDQVLARLQGPVLGRLLAAELSPSELARYAIPADWSRESILELIRNPLRPRR